MRYKNILPFILLLLWIILLVCFYIIVQKFDITIEEWFFIAYSFLKSEWFYGMLFFILLYVIRPLLFIIASPFVVLCGFIYGLPLAFAIFFIAEVCSISFSYFFWKLTWWRIINIGDNFTRIKHMEDNLKNSTFLYMLRLRLIWFPFDLLNYISWILRIPFKPYFFGTMLWVLPYNIAFLTTGAAFYGENIRSFSDIQSEISPAYLFIALFLLLLTFIFSRIVRKLHKL